MAVVHRTAAALRSKGGEVNLLLASQLDSDLDDQLDQAVESGQDNQLLMEDLPVEDGEDVDSGDAYPGEEDPEMLDDLGHFECQECVESAPVGKGLPKPPGSTSAPPPPETELQGNTLRRPLRRIYRRNWLACGPIELRQLKSGRRVWCAVCAYKTRGGRVLSMMRIVGKDSTRKPRLVVFNGRKVPFVTDAEMNRFLEKGDLEAE